MSRKIYIKLFLAVLLLIAAGILAAPPFVSGGIYYRPVAAEQPAGTAEYAIVGNPTANIALVRGGGYSTYGAYANTGASGGTTESHFITKYRLHRIKQSGTIEAVKIYFASKPASLTHFYIEVWRKDGETYDRVGQVDIIDHIANSAGVQDITLPTGIAVLEGDFPGYGFTYSSDPGTFLYRGFGNTNGTRYVVDAAPTATNYAWDSQGGLNYSYTMECMIRAPLLVGFGNSHIASTGCGHSAYLHSATEDSSAAYLADSLVYKLGAATRFNCSVYNGGKPNDGTDELIARWSEVADLKPRIVVMNSPGTDYSESVTLTTYLANLRTLCDNCVSLGARFVLFTIMPSSNYTAEQAREIDIWSDSILRLVATEYPDWGVGVDLRPLVGVFREGGDVGNLWDLNATYNSEIASGHLNAAGMTVLANAILAAAKSNNYILTLDRSTNVQTWNKSLDQSYHVAGNPLTGVATTGTGLYGRASTTGTGVNGSSENGIGVTASSTTSYAASATVNPTSTTTAVETARLARTTSGTAGNNIGGYISGQAETSGGTLREAMRLKWTWSNATDNARTATHYLSGVTSAGAVTDWMSWTAADCSILLGGLVFPDADASPDVVGELIYDNAVTGLDDGAWAWYDGDEIRYLVDLDTLPSDDGYVVTYDSGTQRFVMEQGGSAAAAGSDTQMLFNDGGVIGADEDLHYNKTTNVLTAAGGYNSSATAHPMIQGFDSDCPGTGDADEVGQFGWEYIDGGEGDENADIYVNAMIDGAGEDDAAETEVLRYDESDARWETAFGLSVSGTTTLGTVAGAIDAGGATSWEIPNGADPDIDAAGEISNDTDGANVAGDVTLRGYDGTNQFCFARKSKTYTVTIVKPQDMADAVRDKCVIFQNRSGMDFTVTEIHAISGTDNTTINVEEYDADGQNNATVDAVEIATDGTGLYYQTETTITGATIEAGHIIAIDFDDTDDPDYVTVSISGWYNANVD